MKDMPTGEEEESSQTSFYLYPADQQAINAAMKLGLDYGIRLELAKVIRLLIRSADLTALTKKDFEAALLADDRRRKGNKKAKKARKR